jgi:uncharacterized YccA/Bax inhibitor family protein
MASSNPAFRNSPAFTTNTAKAIQVSQPGADLSATQLDELYGRPSAGPEQTDRMTIEDTMVKIVVSFAVLLVGAAIGWFVPVLAIPAAIGGFALALVNIFKKKPSAPLVLAYALVQGVFVGAVSMFYEAMWDGIVVQALFGTLGVVAVTLALFASGKVRASKRATKIFLVAMLGYAAFSLVNFGLMAFGVTNSMFGLRDQLWFGIPAGIIIGIFVVLLAAYSLVLDFDSIKTGVERGAPRAYAWTAAFGIMVTVIWLYFEILRIIAIARN